MAVHTAFATDIQVLGPSGTDHYKILLRFNLPVINSISISAATVDMKTISSGTLTIDSASSVYPWHAWTESSTWATLNANINDDTGNVTDSFVVSADSTVYQWDLTHASADEFADVYSIPNPGGCTIVIQSTVDDNGSILKGATPELNETSETEAAIFESKGTADQPVLNFTYTGTIGGSSAARVIAASKILFT